jgi:hypothetical protein
MASLLGYFSFGGALGILAQNGRLPWLALGELPLTFAAGSSCYALFKRLPWAPVGLRVVAVALIPLVIGMVVEFPQTLRGDAWLSGLGAIGVWCPLWLWAARRIEREDEDRVGEVTVIV